MKQFDLVIKAGKTFHVLEGKPVEKEKVLIGINASKIEKIFDWSDKDWSAHKTIDASNKLVMPGLINTHAHLPMNLFRGLADDLPFQEWLHNYILPLEARLVDTEFVRLGTELAMWESIRLGITTTHDMYYFEEDIAEVVDKAGLRAVLGENFSSFPAPDNKLEDGTDEQIIRNMVEKYASHERITPWIAPHAPYTVNDAKFQSAAKLSAELNIPLVIHVAETAEEIKNSLKECGKTSVKRLYDLGVMDQPCNFAHCVHVNDEDIEMMAEKNITVAYNPESNMKLGAGAAPIPKMLKAGLKIGLGTDSVASNNDLNLFKEMDAGAKLQKLIEKDNTALTATHCLDMATHMGAQTLFLDKLGLIQEGYLADLIVLDMDQAWLQPQHQTTSNLVYSANGSEVTTTICHGKVLMEDKQMLSIDTEALKNRVKTYRAKHKF